jgi:environmental stress-induced protein Ves
MRFLHAADYRRMPWKNGGGVTTEIAVFPEGSGLDDFEWRISMATVSSDGPFSVFEGIDRTLAVLEGEGIVLTVDGLSDETITRGAPSFSFPADRKASARLVCGPITDLNVMTRRGRWMHQVERLSPALARRAFDGATAAVVFCALGEGTVTSGVESVSLDRHDAAVVNDTPFEVVVGSSAAELYVIRLDWLS